MCFSASASFAGGAIISSIGLMTLIQNKEPSRRLFASVPLVFGVQQFAEGFVWLTLQSPGHDLLLKVSTYIFLIAAVVIWPTMMPLSVVLMEQPKPRRALYIFPVAGIIVSLLYVAGLFLFEVTAQISSYHVLYAVKSPTTFGYAGDLAYLFATVPILFLTRSGKLKLFGLVIMIAYAVTQVFYRDYLVSVWCFFAALASVMIWWIVKEPYTRIPIKRL